MTGPSVREILLISIHPPRAGWDYHAGRIAKMRERFQSTHPVRGGTRSRSSLRLEPCDFNPPTPCGVGHQSAVDFPRRSSISIHPPRAGWDFRCGAESRACRNFNPPTPCGVGPRISFTTLICSRFQSTHPVRGGTPGCGEAGNRIAISIHPPRAGWDAYGPRAPRLCGVFQSTHPVRGGTSAPRRGGGRAANFNPPTPCGVGP